MKALILAAMLLFSSSANATTFYDEPDKVLHTQYSAVGAHALKAIGLTSWQSFWTMMLIGALNEIPSHNTGQERRRDMVANIVGASSVFVWEIKF